MPTDALVVKSVVVMGTRTSVTKMYYDSSMATVLCMLPCYNQFLKSLIYLPCLDPEELSLSTLGFFFLCDPESEDAGLFSTAGVDKALFLNSSLSLSRAGSILAGRESTKSKTAPI